MEQDLRFEELVASLKDQLSRGTVNKYLNELLESKGRFKGFVERRGRRGGPYYVPEKKRRKVKLFLEREETKQHYYTFGGEAIDKSTMKELAELRRKMKEFAELERKVKFFDDPRVIEFLKRKLKE